MIVIRDWIVSLNAGEKSCVLPKESRMRIWTVMESVGFEVEAISGSVVADTSMSSSPRR